MSVGVTHSNIQIVSLGIGEQVFIHQRGDKIIRIEEGRMGHCIPDSGIAGGRESAVFLPDDAHLWQSIRVFDENLWAIVGRTIINNDYFVDWTCLCQQAVKTGAQIGCDVVNWDYQRKQRRIQFFSVSFPACHFSSAVQGGRSVTVGMMGHHVMIAALREVAGQVEMGEPVLDLCQTVINAVKFGPVVANTKVVTGMSALVAEQKATAGGMP